MLIYLETKAKLESFDDQYESHDNIQITSNKVPKNKSSLRQKNVELLAVSDSRYAGKRVSRKNLNSSIEEDCTSSELSLESDNESDENNILEFKNFLKETKNKSKKPNALQESESEDENDEEDSIISELNESEDNEMEEEYEEEEGEEEQEEEEENVGSIDDSEEENENEVQKMSKNSHESDINKGKSIQNQLSLWDKLLECRIKMHKGINLCNQLPQAPYNYKLFTKASGENHFVLAGQGAQVAIKSLLDNCIELQVKRVIIYRKLVQIMKYSILYRSSFLNLIRKQKH
jgi:protein AATF/BFR2